MIGNRQTADGDGCSPALDSKPCTSALGHFRKWRRDVVMSASPRSADIVCVAADYLSGGEQQMVAVARAPRVACAS